MRAEDLFHLGIVADDPEAARAELGSLFGYEWGSEVGGTIEVMLPTGGAVVVDLRCAYSITSPRVEVVRSVPGTMWESAAGVHHLGYWSDDVGADSDELAQSGYVTEATRVGPDGRPFFTFHR
ncbi:MAG: VOC family protein, partial [Rhodococcus sp. (in: high G+C Gram-positive bacteria)]|uniref:VOC family protein n=1 Tax=Rhodococcus sp. TaxID=1831 RepID=UPI003BAF415A